MGLPGFAEIVLGQVEENRLVLDSEDSST